MNLYMCYDCGKKTVCKYYNCSDPRNCEGTCKEYVYVVKKDTTPVSKSEQMNERN